MTEVFIEKIKNYDEPLFYNTDGSTEAYKLCIIHLSAAMSAGVAKLEKGYMIPHDVLYLVDLEKEIVNRVSERIKVIDLEFL